MGIAAAQDPTESLSPYEIALRKIEAARVDSTAVFLSLSGLGLTELPPEIGNLTHLEELVAHNNQLSTLPAEIGNLINLERLGLENNNLVSLPPEIGNLRKLRYLDLQRNELSTLPPEIANLQDLYSLGLYSNQFYEFPSVLNQLDIKLRDPYDFNGYGGGINIEDNPFNSFPRNLATMPTALILIAGISVTLWMVWLRYQKRQNQKSK